MTEPVQIALIIQVFGVIMFFAKSWADRRSAKKENATRDKNFQLKILENQSENISIKMEVLDVKELLKAHIQDNDFQIKYKNALQNRATQELYKYANFSVQHQLILSAWNEIIEKFGIKWYYSDLRKEQKDKKNNGEKIHSLKKDIADKLNQEINLKIDFWNKIIRDNIEDKKNISASSIFFDELLSKKHQNIMPLHSRTELLILALAENGLTNEGYIDLFENYLIEFYSNYKNKLDIWESIKN